MASDDVVLDGGGNVVEGAGLDRRDANATNASVNGSDGANATSAAVANTSENASIVLDANWGEPLEPLIPTDDCT